MADVTIASGVREEYAWSRITPASKHDLHELQTKLMSVISDMAAKEQADFAALTTQLQNIQSGVGNLQTLIKQLQASGGVVTAEDQALIDQMEKVSDSVVAAANAITTAVPAAPVVPVPPSLHQKVGSQIQGAEATGRPVPYVTEHPTPYQAPHTTPYQGPNQAPAPASFGHPQQPPATSVPPGQFPAQHDPGPRDPSLH